MLNSSLTFGGTTVGGGGIRGTIRWMAPELLTYDPEMKSNLHTKASDVWAFGMTVYVSIFSSFCIIFLSLGKFHDVHSAFYWSHDSESGSVRYTSCGENTRTSLWHLGLILSLIAHNSSTLSLSIVPQWTSP